MPLEHFKTQVLLLHSEQSKLDAFRSGFNDRYAVHCATSGTEALNIFGETPIHVIVSAQDLPGMSGLDALREAKKRSPETIAILLAGTATSDGLEALVTDKEVYQVVRGEIAPDALENLIDSATKSVRLLALSEASNDTAANVDEPHDESEHIVMETAENGSVIISDGTGTLPVLKPNKIQISPNAGGQNVDVLVLTQDEEFLSTIRESSRGLHNVHHAVTPNQAAEVARANSVGVLVTDAAMTGSNIETLTEQLRAHAPRLVAVVAGRRDDGELLMDLINRGKVYRFLLKPVSPGRARLAIEASVKHHLEAQDSAFKGSASATPPRPVAKKPAAAKRKPAARKAPKPTAKIATAAAKTAAAAPQAAPAARKEPSIGPMPGAAPSSTTLPEAPSGLDDAFDEPSSFTETVAGLAVSVGKSISSAAESVKNKSAPTARAPQHSEPTGLAKHGKLIGIGVAAVAVAAIAIGALIGGGEDTVEATTAGTAAVTESEFTPPPSNPAPVQAETSPAGGSALFDSALEQARTARSAGNVYAPENDNAIEYYLAALDLAPRNSEARAELDELLADVYASAETALMENRANDANEALRAISLADPENPRLAFLNAQLSQQRFRQLVVEIRTAIRDARFEDAATLLTQAESVPGADGAEIETLNSELVDARSEQRLDDVLQAAAARLNGDQLIAPANDNARYFYQLALNSDPGNSTAQQGLVAIASKLALRARVAIDNGNYPVAESLLAEAQALDPGSAELAASTAALQSARDTEAAEEAARLEAERQAAQAREAEAARIAAERQAAAEREAAQAREAEAARFAAQRQAVAEREAGAAQTANARPAARPVAEPPPMASASIDNGIQGTATAQDGRANATPASVSISSLERTKYVAPRYPRAAQRRNAFGHVDIAFTVNTSGTVEDIEIRDSRPGTLFNDAAMQAVTQWEFEPVVENGVAVPKRVAVRLSFSLE